MPSFRDTHYTETELADFFGVNARTLKRWRDGRGLPFKVIGGRIFYSKESVARWVAQQERQGERRAA